MNDETRIYLELDEDLQQALDDNGIRIEDILREAEVEGRVSHDVLPLQDDGGGHSRDLKTVVTLLFAGSVAVASFSYALNQTLGTIYNKPIYVQYQEPVEIRNADGDVVLDQDGNPVFKLVPRHEILQAQQSGKDEFMTDLNNMVLKISTEDKRE